MSPSRGCPAIHSTWLAKMRSPSATSSAGTVHMTTMLVLPTSDMAPSPPDTGGSDDVRLDVRSPSMFGTSTVPPIPRRVHHRISSSADSSCLRISALYAPQDHPL